MKASVFQSPFRLSKYAIVSALQFAEQFLMEFRVERLQQAALGAGGGAVADFEIGHAEIIKCLAQVGTQARGLFVSGDGFVKVRRVVVGVAEFVVASTELGRRRRACL